MKSVRMRKKIRKSNIFLSIIEPLRIKMNCINVENKSESAIFEMERDGILMDGIRLVKKYYVSTSDVQP